MSEATETPQTPEQIEAAIKRFRAYIECGDCDTQEQAAAAMKQIINLQDKLLAVKDLQIKDLTAANNELRRADIQPSYSREW